MREREDADEGRAPICPDCGVTALPAELANVLDPGFVCLPRLGLGEDRPVEPNNVQVMALAQ